MIQGQPKPRHVEVIVDSEDLRSQLNKSLIGRDLVKINDIEYACISSDGCNRFVLMEIRRICASSAMKAEWTGEGLPPEGTVCEVKGCMSHYLQWNKVTVFAVRGKTVLFDMEDGRWGQTDSHEFRPIRTPEQIAAEEKNRVINEMIAGLEPFEAMAPLAVCEWLFDKGYRKFEIVEN